MNSKTRNQSIALVAGIFAFLTANSAYSAPGTLATAPLFVTTAVEPNIFLILDDSGSMDWETMYKELDSSIESNEGNPIIADHERAYYNPDWDANSDREIIPATAYNPETEPDWLDKLWVLRNHNGNALYYNPDIDYQPWPGLDADGNALYTQADPTRVLENPNATWNWTDITQTQAYEEPHCECAVEQYLPEYYIWKDDGNGVFEATDDHELVQIRSTRTTYPSGRTYTEEINNFANWMQYYRKREYAAKAAIGPVIHNSDSVRMGVEFLNGGLQNEAATLSEAANKLSVLESVYALGPNGGTPLRNTLVEVGQYFQIGPDDEGTPTILSAAEGGTCQQNFAIAMTDGFWNQSLLYSIGNEDKNSDDGSIFDGNQFQSNDGGNYADEWSQTFADVAMKYYETDLRPDLADEVPATAGVDLATHQHLVTYTVSFGLTGHLDPEVDDPLSVNAEGNTNFAWPLPWASTNDPGKIDDLWHAAYNARGKFLSAQNPEELEESLGEAIADIAERTATASAAAVTTARLTTDSVIYLSEFNTNRWQGNLYAYTITEENGSLSLSHSWNAGSALNARTNPQTTRQIITYDRSSDGVAFQWDSISDDMKDDLKTNAQGETDSDEIGEARLNYLRGDRSNEGQGLQFRPRVSLLGDIVYSAPVYVSEPGVGWPDEAPFPTAENLTYSDFVAAHSDDPDTTADEARDGVIYVGANDGMLHAFNESDGSELFGYIPSYLASDDNSSGLHYLTEQDYIHKFYNDLSPTVSDVFLDTGNGDGTGWHTILIGGQRAGGRGYFALDITNPANLNETNAANMAMWEFSYLDDADLGYTFSRPQVALANNGKWVAIFGNGYNGTGDGAAKLFIVNIEGPGENNIWGDSNYTELSTGAGTTDNLNGLSSPQLVDLDGNGTVDRVYAGDLFGNLWAFDLSGATTGSWEVAYSGSPLFTTIGNRPITTRPAVSFHPTESTTNSTEPNIMITFGSGQYLVDADKTINDSTPAEYFYGVWDEGSSGLDSDDLVEQTFVSGVTDSDGNAVRVLTSNEVDYQHDNGWYIELPDAGERQITNSTIRSGTVFFNTSVPENDPCSTGGYGYRFTVDLATGGALSDPVIDYDGDGEVGDEGDFVAGSEGDVIPSAGGLPGLPPEDNLTENYIINRTDLIRVLDAPDRQTGRLSWQELLQ